MNIKKYIVRIVLLATVMTEAAPYTMSQELTPKQDEKGKWGLVNADGAVVVKPQYSGLMESRNGSFLIAVGGKEKDGILEGEKWGVLDANGQVLVKAEYDEIGDFTNGLSKLKKGNKVGFANEKWQIVIEPKYSFAGLPNVQGFVWVNSGGKLDKAGNISGGKYGAIDVKGNVIVPVKYKSLGFFTTIKEKKDTEEEPPKTKFQRLVNEAGGHRLLMPKAIQKKPDWILPEIIGFAFSDKQTTTNYLVYNGICDLEGKILVKNNVYMSCYPTDDIAIIHDKKDVIGFHDIRTGEKILDKKLDAAYPFMDGIAVCMDKNKKYYFYDKKFQSHAHAYDWISPRQGDFYIVLKGDEMELINAFTLETVVAGKDLIFPESNGYMLFRDLDNGKYKYGFLNSDGSVALKPQFDDAYSFKHGAAIVFGEKDNSGGMLDSSLRVRIPLQYYTIKLTNSDDFRHVWVQETEDGPYTCLLWNTGKKAFDKQFVRAWNYEMLYGRYLAYVGTDKETNIYGVIDEYGNLVLPIEFEGYDTAQKALEYLIRTGAKEWSPIHSYRFHIYNDPDRNRYNLGTTIEEYHWDY